VAPEPATEAVAATGAGATDKKGKHQGRAHRRRRRANLELLRSLGERGLEAKLDDRGIIVTLPDLIFEFGRSDLAESSGAKISAIASALLAEARGRRVEVAGHSDSIGTELYNLGLSKRRAEGVAEALIDRGVLPLMLSVAAYGSKYPVAPNVRPNGADDPRGRALNRRVEIVIEK